MGPKRGPKTETGGKALAFKGARSERVGFEPTVRLPVQRFSNSKTLTLLRTACAGLRATILACDGPYRAVPRGSFAIWFGTPPRGRRGAANGKVLFDGPSSRRCVAADELYDAEPVLADELRGLVRNAPKVIADQCAADRCLRLCRPGRGC